MSNQEKNGPLRNLLQSPGQSWTTYRMSGFRKFLRKVKNLEKFTRHLLYGQSICFVEANGRDEKTSGRANVQAKIKLDSK